MPTATARISNTVIASTDKWETVDNNVYFPPNTIKDTYFATSNTHTVCPWKGTASYYDVTVDGKTVKDAAWYYPDTKEKAANIKDHVAFCEFDALLSAIMLVDEC
jgi:uncharacterized protein (DUF427 family)